MFPLFLQLPEKMVLDPNWPYISTFQTILRNVCLSIISEFCLSVGRSVCRASTAYTSFCRGLKYLLKVRYIILNYPNVARFLISEILCLGRAKILTYVWKKYHKTERHLSLVTHNFTKLSQNVCLISTYILIYRYARCNCKLWKTCIFT